MIVDADHAGYCWYLACPTQMSEVSRYLSEPNFQMSECSYILVQTVSSIVRTPLKTSVRMSEITESLAEPFETCLKAQPFFVFRQLSTKIKQT